MNAFLVVLSVALLLVSASLGVASDRKARRHFPLQFADELSSRYYAQYMLFNRTIPLTARRLFALSSVFGFAAFAGFAAVAYRSGNPVIAALLLLPCGIGAASIFSQWRRARR